MSFALNELIQIINLVINNKDKIDYLINFFNDITINPLSRQKEIFIFY
jgi:hypothetical protein